MFESILDLWQRCPRLHGGTFALEHDISKTTNHAIACCPDRSVTRAGDISSWKGRSLKQGSGGGSGSGFNSNNQGNLLGGFFNLGSLGLNFGSLQSQITAALLSGNQQQASNLIKQGLQGGNTGAVSQALASASANVSRPDARI